MARVQYGVIVTGLKGKVGGTIFQGGNNSQVMKNANYRKGFRSVNRNKATNDLSKQARGWRSLGAGQPASWEALSPTWTFIDSFGVTYEATGYQIFISCNALRASIGLTPLTTAPAVAAPTDPGAMVITIDTAGEVILNWANNGGVNDYLIVFASPPMSAGNSGNNVRMIKLASINVSGSSTETFTSEYSAAYGNPPAGSYVMFYYAFRIASYPRDAFFASVKVAVT